MRVTARTWDETFDIFKIILLEGPIPLGRALQKANWDDEFGISSCWKNVENSKLFFFKFSLCASNFHFLKRRGFQGPLIRSPPASDSWNRLNGWHKANRIALLLPEPIKGGSAENRLNLAFSLIFALQAPFSERETSAVGLNFLTGCNPRLGDILSPRRK